MKKIFISTLSLFAILSTPAMADTSSKCPGEEGYYYKNYRSTNNPQDGGFVAYTATVEDNQRIVIGRMAAVCGNAIILDNANIGGNALVRGNAEVSGGSIVTGDVILEGNVSVGGRSVIKGSGILSSGNIIDEKKEMSGPLNSSQSNLAPDVLAVKVQEFVRKYAASLAPSDGSFYDGYTVLHQSVFFNGACSLSIRKNRSNGSEGSSFNGESIVSLSMKDVTNVYTRFYSPGFSTVSIQMKSAKTSARRSYRMNSNSEWYTGDNGWTNHYHTYNSNTAESFEVKTMRDAEVLAALIKDLKVACSR